MNGSQNHPHAGRQKGVASYLSDQWFDEVGALDSGPGAASPDADLVVQHVVTGGPDGAVSYHVCIGDGIATVVRGRAAQPHVTFAEDYATAAAVARGDMSAPAALLAGRIRVGGDLASLIAHHDGLVVDDPVPAAVRAATTY